MAPRKESAKAPPRELPCRTVATAARDPMPVMKLVTSSGSTFPTAVTNVIVHTYLRGEAGR